MSPIASLLTLLGLVPFVYFGLGAVGHIPETSERMLVSLIDYAALILGFAGGVHWGMAIWPNTMRTTLRFIGGVVPLIAAWAALVLAQLIAPSVALIVLIAAYLATVLTEHRSGQRLLIPRWYVGLRWVISVVAIVTMTLVLVMRGLGRTIAL